jgi:nucleotide-binding universal stress UspA family protein
MRVRPACRPRAVQHLCVTGFRDILHSVSRRPGFHRILFAVNGSPHSAAAVPVVAAIVSNSQSELLVVDVWSPDDSVLEHDDELSRRRNDDPDVSAVVERLHAAGVAAMGESHGATSESVAVFIGGRANTFDADLIALARTDFLVIAATQSRLRSRLAPGQRLAPGLTAKLLQSCPCPLLVAPARELSTIRLTPLGAAASGRPRYIT